MTHSTDVQQLRVQLEQCHREARQQQGINDKLRNDAKSSMRHDLEALQVDQLQSTSNCNVDIVEWEARVDGIGTDLTYKPYVPQSCFESRLHFRDTVKCPACGDAFAAHIADDKTYHAQEYYRHCIVECDRYKELGLIKKCSECKLLFINANSRRIHTAHHNPSRRHQLRTRGLRHKPDKPSWMCTATYDYARLVTASSTATASVACAGCGKEFKARETAKAKQPELAFFVHVIDQCEDYRKLQLTRDCSECNCSFHNLYAYIAHKCVREKSAFNDDQP